MQSLVHLYNTALARLGGEQIPLNISPIENDAVGAICQSVFPHILESALEAYAWSFAKKRAVLALLPETAPRNRTFAFRYAQPSDCVTPVRIIGMDRGAVFLESEDGPPAYVIEGGDILCNVARAELLYVSRSGDIKNWPAYFSEYLVWKMAGALAAARNNDIRQQQTCEQMAEGMLAKACAKDRAAANPYRTPSPWSVARGNRSVRAPRGWGW